jgi:amidophosphoribosyltransferase
MDEITLERIIEQKCNLRDFSGESCALAAVINVPNASEVVYDCLVLQEHRGEKSSGIISAQEGNFFHKKEMGLAREVFLKFNFDKKLPGKTAIGHNRYATHGAHDSVTNIQPLFFHESKFGPFAIAHNGTLSEGSNVKKQLISEGCIFQSTTDSELMAHLIARSDKKDIEHAVIDAANKIKAAYALMILTPDKLIALKDKFGVRPLSIGKLDGGYVICSENFAFAQNPNCEHIREITPGEMIIFERDVSDFRAIQYASPDEKFCVFEPIYFSHPRTRYGGIYNEDFRLEQGIELFRQNPNLGKKGDLVIPILDSGKYASIRLAEALNVPYEEALLRIHNPPIGNIRSFTSPTQNERKSTISAKFNLREDAVKGRRVITVDDSIVRSTTMSAVNKRLRDAGAEYIINCIASPPIIDVCPCGMDFQDPNELVAYNRSLSEIKKKIGADELIYLSLKGLNNVVKRTFNSGVCTGCFGGNYPG